MTEYGRLIGPAELEFTRTFEASQDKVWQFLVDPEKRKLWFCGGSTDDYVGGKITFEFDHRRLAESPPLEKYASEETVTHYGEILEYDPPSRLAFTWFEPGSDESSKVVISLTAVDDKTTQLHLVHDGLVARDILIGVFAGWHGHFNLLAEVLVGPRVSDFWVLTAKLEAEYEERI
jgi:uncharacterized protein YndB with AHSA1/START domain